MDDIDHLYGRVTALELIVTGFMTKLALESGMDPLGFVKGWRPDMMGSLQHTEREVSEKADQRWAAAVDALDLVFDNLEKRLAHIAK